MGILSFLRGQGWSPKPRLEIFEAPRRLPTLSQLETAHQHQEALKIAETINPCRSVAIRPSVVSVRPTGFPVSPVSRHQSASPQPQWRDSYQRFVDPVPTSMAFEAAEDISYSDPIGDTLLTLTAAEVISNVLDSPSEPVPEPSTFLSEAPSSYEPPSYEPSSSGDDSSGSGGSDW